MSWLHPYQWVPVTAPLTSGTARRDARLLEQIVAQFEVETASRYRPTATATYCNIFLSDVTKALGCEIPHWWNGRELTANAVARWLAGEEGGQNGWTLVSRRDAEIAANIGQPAVAVWANPKGVGHVALLVPSTGETQVAQAGRVNFSRGSLESGFGRREVVFYSHK